jgi:quercetin dioxygenase-like cupin family protein
MCTPKRHGAEEVSRDGAARAIDQGVGCHFVRTHPWRICSVPSRQRARRRAVSVALSDNPPGGGAPEHRHPCGEVFVVYEGRGVYCIGGVEVVAEAGDIVVVPPNTWHSFRADGDLPLRHVAAFDTAQVETELHSA